MLAYVDYKAVEVDVDINVRLRVRLDPGLWLVTEEGHEYSVTTIEALVSPEGGVILMYPKGVPRRPSGTFGAREHVLADFRSWHLIPQKVRAVIEDAFLLRRSALPESLEEAQ